MVLSLASCASERTELVVEVETDLRIPGELDAVNFRTADNGPPDAERTVTGAEDFPLRWVVSTEGATRSVAVVVTGIRGDLPVVSQTALVAFKPDATRTLRVELRRLCIGVPCQSGETCTLSPMGTAQCRSVFDFDVAPPDGGNAR
ncbi:MAG: hypothetical protein KC417_02780 [Myxococcales bacterium]|nr:hypothetical protein [Myxococcales bacterium]